MKKLFSRVLALLILGVFMPFLPKGQCTVNPPLNLGPDVASCDGINIDLDAGTGYISYIWNTGEITPSINVSTSGIYFVRVTDIFNCVGTDSVIVTISENLSVDLGPDINACEEDTIILDAGVGPYTYEWPNATTDQTLRVLTSGIYWVEISDSILCSARDSITITFFPNPRLSLDGDTTICAGGRANLMAAPGFDSYIWSNGMVGQLITVTTAGEFDVTVTDSMGCMAVSQNTVSVSVAPNPPKPELTWDGTTLSSTPGDSFKWYLNTFPFPDLQGQNVFPRNEGNYTVQVISSTGCLSPLSDPVFVTFTVTEEDIVQVFTPDGDGINDVFHIKYIETLADNSLSVFNRWGQPVYEVTGYRGDWKGTSANGKELPEGVYYYILKINNGQNTELTGFVEIRR